jgi:hypothetical protein
VERKRKWRGRGSGECRTRASKQIGEETSSVFTPGNNVPPCWVEYHDDFKFISSSLFSSLFSSYITILKLRYYYKCCPQEVSIIPLKPEHGGVLRSVTHHCVSVSTSFNPSAQPRHLPLPHLSSTSPPPLLHSPLPLYIYIFISFYITFTHLPTSQPFPAQNLLQMPVICCEEKKREKGKNTVISIGVGSATAASFSSPNC